MSRIGSRNTGPERLLRRELRETGLRGWRLHYRAAPKTSSVDIAFTRSRVAVFVDGCFWHGHPRFFTPGKSGAYWDAKIARNKARDRATNRALRRVGWTVIRFWDFDVEERPSALAKAIAREVRRRRVDQ